MPDYIEIIANPDFLKVPVKGMLPEVETNPLKLTEELLKQLLPNYQAIMAKVKIYVNDPKKSKKALATNDIAKLTEAAKNKGITLSDDESQAVFAFVCIKYVMQELWFANLKKQLSGSTILLTLTRNGENVTLQYTQKEKVIDKYSIPLQSLFKVKSSVLIMADGTFPTTDNNTETIYIRDSLMDKHLKPALKGYLDRRLLDERDLYVILPLLVDVTVRQRFNEYLKLKGVTASFREYTASMIDWHFADEKIRKQILDDLPDITLPGSELPSASVEQVSLEHTTQGLSADSNSAISQAGTDLDETHKGPPLLSSLSRTTAKRAETEDEKKADKVGPSSVNEEVLGLIGDQVEMKVTETDEQVLVDASKQRPVPALSQPTGFTSFVPETNETSVSPTKEASPIRVRFSDTDSEPEDASAIVIIQEETETPTTLVKSNSVEPPAAPLSDNVAPLFKEQNVESGDNNSGDDEEETKPTVETQKAQEYRRLSPTPTMATEATSMVSIADEDELISHIQGLNSSVTSTPGIETMERSTTPDSSKTSTDSDDDENEEEDEVKEDGEKLLSPKTTSDHLTFDSSVVSPSSASDTTVQQTSIDSDDDEDEEEDEVKKDGEKLLSPKTTSDHLTFDSSVVSPSSASDATVQQASITASITASVSTYSGDEAEPDNDLITALQLSEQESATIDLHALESGQGSTLTDGALTASPSIFKPRTPDEDEDQLFDTSTASQQETSALVSGLTSRPTTPDSGTGHSAKKSEAVPQPPTLTVRDYGSLSLSSTYTSSATDEDKTEKQTRIAEQLKLKTDETGKTRIEIFDLHMENLQTIIDDGELDESMLESCKRLQYALTKSLTAEQINQSLDLLTEVIKHANIAAIEPTNDVNLKEAQQLIAPLNRAKHPGVAVALTKLIAGAALIIVASAVAFASFSAGIVGMIGLEVGTGLITKALGIAGYLIGAGLVWSGIGIFDKRPTPPLQPVLAAAEQINQNAERRLQSISVR